MDGMGILNFCNIDIWSTYDACCALTTHRPSPSYIAGLSSSSKSSSLAASFSSWRAPLRWCHRSPGDDTLGDRSNGNKKHASSSSSSSTSPRSSSSKSSSIKSGQDWRLKIFLKSRAFQKNNKNGTSQSNMIVEKKNARPVLGRWIQEWSISLNVETFSGISIWRHVIL